MKITVQIDGEPKECAILLDALDKIGEEAQKRQLKMTTVTNPCEVDTVPNNTYPYEKWKNADNKYKKEWNEAFDMAIEALSADAEQGGDAKMQSIAKIPGYMQQSRHDDGRHQTCDTCKYNNLTWDEEPCDSCTIGTTYNHWTSVDRPTGRWVRSGNTLICPICGAKGEDIKDDYCFNYCPNCGARMKGEK